MVTLHYIVSSMLCSSFIHTSHLTKKTIKHVTRKFNWTCSLSIHVCLIQKQRTKFLTLYNPVVTSCFTSFNITKFPVLCVDLRTLFFSFYSIDWSVFINETECCNVTCSVHSYQISYMKIIATTYTYKDFKFLIRLLTFQHDSVAATTIIEEVHLYKPKQRCCKLFILSRTQVHFTHLINMEHDTHR